MTRQITTINPATEQVINTYEIVTKEQIKEKTKKAHNAHLDWKKDMDKRADHIHDFAQELRKRTRKSLQGKSHKKWERLQKKQGLKSKNAHG